MLIFIPGYSFYFSLLLLSGQSEEIESVPDFLLDLEQVRINFIYDGDTVRTDTGEKIRLLGVDAPEMNWGKESRTFMPGRLLNIQKKYYWASWFTWNMMK